MDNSVAPFSDEVFDKFILPFVLFVKYTFDSIILLFPVFVTNGVYNTFLLTIFVHVLGVEASLE